MPGERQGEIWTDPIFMTDRPRNVDGSFPDTPPYVNASFCLWWWKPHNPRTPVPVGVVQQPVVFSAAGIEADVDRFNAAQVERDAGERVVLADGVAASVHAAIHKHVPLSERIVCFTLAEKEELKACITGTVSLF